LSEIRSSNRYLILPLFASAVCALSLLGCKHDAKAAATAPQAMPVKVAQVALSPVPRTNTYVATVQSRRSATLQPQVDGNLIHIYVKSGDTVKAGQVLMQIDPLKQKAVVQSQQGTQAQKKALYEYNQIQIERQRKLFEAGVVSRDAYDQAIQAYQNSKADYEANAALTTSQQQQLSYYQIRAPFDGIVGDIPVRLGDYVSPTTVLTTVDEIAELEAYIYVPIDRATEVRMGLPVELLDNSGNVLAKSTIRFLSPQVDNNLQSILVKAGIPRSAEVLRHSQLVRARITWTTEPAPVVPVLAVSLIGGQPFVYVAQHKGDGYVAHQVPVKLGETVGNDYPVISGLKPDDKVILSGLQFLQDGAPVQPLS
jgi:RND family efflux transporter MFP subunit